MLYLHPTKRETYNEEKLTTIYEQLPKAAITTGDVI
jgi:hypothetical protein